MRKSGAVGKPHLPSSGRILWKDDEKIRCGWEIAPTGFWWVDYGEPTALAYYCYSFSPHDGFLPVNSSR